MYTSFVPTLETAIGYLEAVAAALHGKTVEVDGLEGYIKSEVELRRYRDGSVRSEVHIRHYPLESEYSKPVHRTVSKILRSQEWFTDLAHSDPEKLTNVAISAGIDVDELARSY